MSNVYASLNFAGLGGVWIDPSCEISEEEALSLLGKGFILTELLDPVSVADEFRHRYRLEFQMPTEEAQGEVEPSEEAGRPEVVAPKLFDTTIVVVASGYSYLNDGSRELSEEEMKRLSFRFFRARIALTKPEQEAA